MKGGLLTARPLDVMWGMVGEFATVEVREAVCCAARFHLITPEETVNVLEKTALYQPSATAIKRHPQKRRATWLETMDETLNQSIRQQGGRPPEGTKVMVATPGWDITLRLKVAGEKTRASTCLRACKLHAQCPSAREARGKNPRQESPTHFKQALVGSLSFYVDHRPLRQHQSFAPGFRCQRPLRVIRCTGRKNTLPDIEYTPSNVEKTVKDESGPETGEAASSRCQKDAASLPGLRGLPELPVWQKISKSAKLV